MLRLLLLLAVTALLGCKSVGVEDRRENQILICHKGSKTLNVSNADYQRHIDHGDSVGPCASGG